MWLIIGQTYNRTMLELKYLIFDIFRGNMVPYNRTMLELKYRIHIRYYGSAHSYNRTMLELKCTKRT